MSVEKLVQFTDEKLELMRGGPDNGRSTIPEPEISMFEDQAVRFSDIGNARRFAMQHKNLLRYNQAWGWLRWDGRRWKTDDTSQVMELAKQTVRRLWGEYELALGKNKDLAREIQEAAKREDASAGEKLLTKLKSTEDLAIALRVWAKKSQERARLEAMIGLARSEPELVATPDKFDRDPWLLNVKNGILDMRTGELHPHSPAALMTKIAGAEYDPDAECPTWTAFLSRIFSDNHELIDFLKRAVGYSLTATTGEQCLFFLYGTGANGKSTFTGALQEMLGDYAMKTRAETLMIKKQDSIPEEVAQLAGVRFMLAAELSEGQRLNESLIKDLTGGDKIRARLLYQKSFEFHPVAKPWLYGNHKPAIRGTDEGIWRRPKLIDFAVTIPEKERNPYLPEDLKQELSGVLSWAVEGCLEWQRGGLKMPACVTHATEKFRAEQDALGSFLEDSCLINPLASVTAGILYDAYKTWCAKGNENALNQRKFSQALEERGYSTRGNDGKPIRDANGRAVYRGIGLLDTEDQEEGLND